MYKPCGIQKMQWLLFDGSLELHYTKDPQYYNSIEIRPWLMTTARWTSLIKHIYMPYLSIMLEYRNILYEDDELDEHKFRMRLRTGTKFTINSQSMSVGTVYIPLRIEFFVDISGSATERFANKSRLQVGIGYIFSSAFRSELVYYLNGSRNTYEDKFTETDQIFQLLFRHYF